MKTYVSITPCYTNVSRYAEVTDKDRIIELILNITPSITYETAIEVVCWCELASVGDLYENPDFTCEIIVD